MIETDIKKQKYLSSDMKYWIHMGNVIDESTGKLVKDYWFTSSVAEDWRFKDRLIDNPISNLEQEYLFFKDSSVFRQEAKHFEKKGFYTQAPEGTHAYHVYWDEQESRCKNGFMVDGVRISGRMYFMLNFGRMKATEVDKNGNIIQSSRKTIRFPRFLDIQFYVLNEIEKCFAENIWEGANKESLALAKSRRKGMTYVMSAGVICYNYTFMISSNTVTLAGESDHYKVTNDAVWYTINHIDANTEFGQNRHKKSAVDYFKASYIEQGTNIERGSFSEVRFASLKDNAFKAIGESADAVLFEEAGKCKGLRHALRVTEPVCRDGDYQTGVCIIWGTGGDMSSSGALDLSKVFYNPKAYKMKAYKNIYDKDAKGSCGLFIDDMWYLPGDIVIDGVKHLTVDSNGNSYRKYAEMILDAKREDCKNTDDYDLFVTQQPKTPKEAFMVVLGNKFPVKMIGDRIAELTDSVEFNSRWIGRFKINSEGKLDFQHDSELSPLDEYPIENRGKLAGAIVIHYKPDMNDKGLIFKNRYVMGVDPYAQDKAGDSVSVGSCFVFDRLTRRIAAEYTGRPDIVDEFHIQVMYLAMYYGAKVNYENQTPGFDKVFEKYNNLHLLAPQPAYIRAITQNTKVDRAYGCHATSGIITAYLALIKSWLMSLDEIYADGRYMLHSICSLGLLEELRQYVNGKNFDRVVALGMALILDKEYENIEIEGNDTNVSLDTDNIWLDMMFSDKNAKGKFIESFKFDNTLDFVA